MDVPRGKYTDMFLPRYEMSPGSLPSGRPVRPNSSSKPPATSRSNPKPMSTRPKSVMAPFSGGAWLWETPGSWDGHSGSELADRFVSGHDFSRATQAKLDRAKESAL